MTMNDRIKSQRIKLGLTQEELAEKLGLQKSAIAKYEKGRVENIKRSTIVNMAKILDCSPCYLLGFEDDEVELKEQVMAPCDMFSSCHGKEAYQMVQQFLNLDQADRLVIYGRILGMLDAEKYKRKEGALSRHA